MSIEVTGNQDWVSGTSFRNRNWSFWKRIENLLLNRNWVTGNQDWESGTSCWTGTELLETRIENLESVVEQELSYWKPGLRIWNQLSIQELSYWKPGLRFWNQLSIQELSYWKPGLRFWNQLSIQELSYWKPGLRFWNQLSSQETASKNSESGIGCLASRSHRITERNRKIDFRARTGCVASHDRWNWKKQESEISETGPDA